MKKLSALLLLLCALPAAADELPPGAVLLLGSTRWRAGATITLTAFRTGGRELLTVSADHVAIIWDVKSGRELRRFSVGGSVISLEASPNSVDAGRVAVSADGRVVATLGWNRTLSVYDIDTGKNVWNYRYGQGNNVPALSPDGRLLALYQQPGSIKMWDLVKNEALETMSDLPPAHGGTNYVYRLEFSRDGKTLTQVGMTYRPNGGVGPNVILWDVAKTERIKQHDALPEGAEREAVFRAFPAGDGKTLIVPTPKSIALMDLTTGRELRRLKDVEHVAASSFLVTPDGKELVQLIGHGEALVIWDLTTGNLARRFGKADESTGEQAVLTNLSISPDGKTLAFGDDTIIAMIDLHTGKRLIESAGHSTALLGAYYSPDGRSIITRSDTRGIRWDATSGKVAERFDLPARFTSFLLSRDAKWIVASSPNMLLHVLDAATRQEQRTISPDLIGTYTYTVAANSRTLIVLGRDASHLLAFDLTTGRKTAELRLPAGVPDSDPSSSLRRLATTHDSRLVVGSTEKSIIVWDLDWPREVQHVDLPDGQRLRHVTFSPDGRSLAVEFYGGEIVIWEVATGARRRLLTRGSDDRRPPNDGVRLPAALAFSRDGRLIANAGADRLVRLFDARTGHELGSFAGHQEPVTGVSFSPDSSRLVTACSDGTALVWDVAPLRSKLDVAGRASKLDDSWVSLGDPNAEKAYDAILSLAADPARSVALLREKLTPVAPPDATRLAKLIADLDAAKYSERQKARKALEKLGDLAFPAVREAATNGSAEARSVARGLIEAMTTRRLTAEQVRQLRAIEALELIATPEAQELLKSLATGAAAAPQTIDAKLALERLNGEPRP